MGDIMELLNWFIQLGPSVMIPIIIIIIGLLVGVKFGKALKAGLMIGIGFIGLGAIIDIMTKNLGPITERMVANYNLDLHVLDVGWPGAAAIAFASKIGAIIIPVGILVNILMLITKSTKTLNIDIWNFWHFAFTGAIVHRLTNNFWWGIFAAVINMIIIMIVADRTAKATEKYSGLEGVSIPHAFSASYVPLAWGINKLIDCIPGLNSINVDIETLNKKLGFLAEPAILGTLIGILLASLAKYNITLILQTGVTLGAVLVLIPKMTTLLMEGLMPISEAIQVIIQKKFHQSKLFIGLDSAVGVGNPVVLTVSLLLIPITIFLAAVIPGNQFLPFASLAGLPFMFVLIIVITKGDFLRTFIVGIFMIIIGLLIGTWMAPLFTTAAIDSAFNMPSDTTLISSIDYGSSPLPFIITWAMKLSSVIGASIISIITLILMLWNRSLIKKENNDLK